jgi:hypothetical protein
MGGKSEAQRPLHDRALLLHGPKRNAVLTLDEVEQYGRDSFGDSDYVSIYGMRPSEWHGRGIRVLGRTAVECTRDVLADAIGREVASAVAGLSPVPRILVLDPLAGSCNTLHWILQHLPGSVGLAFELDPMVFELAGRNLALLGRPIELLHGGYETLLAERPAPPDAGLVVFVAPPWGTALDEEEGLDLRRTVPPITDVIDRVLATFPERRLLFAVQVYEKVEPASLSAVEARLDQIRIHVYGFNAPGRNHGLLVGVRGWEERPASGRPPM